MNVIITKNTKIKVMEIKYLMTEEIVAIHDDIIKKSGGHYGIINYGNLDFVSAQMKTTKGLIKKACVLLYGILTSHPFIDGNKRTAFRAMETFLNVNNKEFVADEEDIWINLYNISEGKMNMDETLKWVKNNTR